MEEFWPFGVAAVGVVVMLLAARKTRKPAAQNTQSEVVPETKQPSNRCRVCGKGKAEHKACSIEASRGEARSFHGILRRFWAVPAIFIRTKGTWGEIAYCEMCVHILDSLDDEHIFWIRARHMEANTSVAAATARHMQTREERAKARLNALMTSPTNGAGVSSVSPN